MALLVVVVGVAAGVTGVCMNLFFLAVQALTYGSWHNTVTQDVLAAHPVRRVLGPLTGGLLAGLGWWWLRRRGPLVGVPEVVSGETGRLPLGRTLADAFLQLLVVGAGASIGREGAPRQASAAIADRVARTFRVPAQARRTLVAAAAGAGLAAVYNVPLAGALFALEALPMRRRPGPIAAVLAVSVVATVTAWPVEGRGPVYEFPAIAPTPQVLVWSVAWAVLAIPACALAGYLFVRIAGTAERYVPAPGLGLPLAIGAASAAVGAASIALPMLPGNGMDILQFAFEEPGGEGLAPAVLALLFAVLLVAKPLVTALCLRSGATGGLLTPALAVGGALGALVAMLAQAGFAATGLADPEAVEIALFALIGAAGVLAVTQKAPWFAAAMVWELTQAPWWTLPIALLVTLGSVQLHRLRGGSSSMRTTRDPRT